MKTTTARKRKSLLILRPSHSLPFPPCFLSCPLLILLCRCVIIIINLNSAFVDSSKKPPPAALALALSGPLSAVQAESSGASLVCSFMQRIPKERECERGFLCKSFKGKLLHNLNEARERRRITACGFSHLAPLSPSVPHFGSCQLELTRKTKKSTLPYVRCAPPTIFHTPLPCFLLPASRNSKPLPCFHSPNSCLESLPNEITRVGWGKWSSKGR